MVDITEISAMVAAAGVLIGVVYYILDMRNQTILRKTDLVMRLFSTFSSEDHRTAGKKVIWITYKDYDDYVKKYGAPNSEEVGVLLSKKLIDIDLIDQLFGYNIMLVGAKVMPILEEGRKRLNVPRFWVNFEYLYNEMKRREQQLQHRGVRNG
jgi:hypothetical protein